MLKIITTDVAINLNIFGTIIKDRIVDNLSGFLIIIIMHESWFKKGTLISQSHPYNQTIFVVVDVIAQHSTFG
jgi:hypothetical protein